MRYTSLMAEPTHFPDADRQEQLVPAGPEGNHDPVERVVARTEAPEADLLEQETPSGQEPSSEMPAHTHTRRELIPEADAMEQATPADREIFEDDE